VTQEFERGARRSPVPKAPPPGERPRPGHQPAEARWAVLREKLEANEAHLVRQGVFVEKYPTSTARWALRFRVKVGGRTVLKSIAVGDDDQRRRAQEWLERHRDQRRCCRELIACARLATMTRTVVRRLVGRR
jgi:hypothetical protein